MRRLTGDGSIVRSALLSAVLCFPGVALAQDAPSCKGKSATIYVLKGIVVGGPDDGKPFTGTLRGTNGDDVIVATGSGDEVVGGEGDDLICTEPDDDSVTG